MFQLSFFQVILLSIINILFVLIAVAYYTLAERKIMAAIQRRRGPNVVGIWGLLQPLADGLKAVLKEIIIPRKANRIIFLGAPVLTLVLSLAGWIVIPLNMSSFLADINLGLLYIFALSSLNVYSIIFAGWSSNSKYAFLGSLRSTAQLISYELILSSALLLVVLITGNLSLTGIVESQRIVYTIFPLLPVFIIFFIGSVAETNRAPFDLAEAESELVSGFMTEHSAAIFVFFFLAEYASIVLICIFTSILFLGGYLPFFSYDSFFNILYYLSLEIKDRDFLFTIINEDLLFSLSLGIKTSLLIFSFIWVRASFPRIRFDQLMSYCWTVLLPIIIALIIFMPCLVYNLNILPINFYLV